MKKIPILIIALMVIGVGLLYGCINNKEVVDSRSWHTIDTFSLIIYNGTIALDLNYSGGFDGTNFSFPLINPDDYQYVATIGISNTGTIYEDFIIDFEGGLFLEKQDTTAGEYQKLAIGKSDENDVSMLLAINHNSSQTENYILISEDVINNTYEIGKDVKPGDETKIYVYIKSYSRTYSGIFKPAYRIQLTASASTTEPEIEVDLDFELSNIKLGELVFDMELNLNFTSDVNLGELIVSSPKGSYMEKISVNPASEESNIYHFVVPIEVKGNDFDYPFDDRTGYIELFTKDNNKTRYLLQSLDKIKKDTPLKNTSEWKVTISTKDNKIFFNFTRNNEQEVFWLLCYLNIVFLILGIIIILSIRFEWTVKNKLLSVYLPRIDIIPWVALSFFGLRYIVFYSPYVWSKGPIILGLVCIVLFCLNAISKYYGRNHIT